MNEILKGLNRRGLDRRELTSVAASAKTQQDPYPMEMRSQEVSDFVSETKPTAMRLKVKSGSVFDLKGADNRMKAILDPHSIVGEQYRMLRAKLSLMQRQTGVKTVLISSTVNSEGKTLISCGLAAVLAQEPGKRALLIDADLRKPDVYRNFGLIGEDRFSGLSQLLQGETSLEESVLSAANQGLYLLPAGPVPNNPAELLSSGHLERLLKEAADSFDWIVIDSPPILPLADATILAPLCDTVLLVVHAKSTPAKLIKSAIQAIGRDKFGGVVLNHVYDLKSSTYYYYYHHHRNLRGKK